MKDIKGKEIRAGDYVEIVDYSGKRPIGHVIDPAIKASFGVRVQLTRTDRKGFFYYSGNDLIIREPEELI